MAVQVKRRSTATRVQPVAFFKATTGIDDLSWNSGFHLLSSWAFRLQGTPVVYFACRAGMSRCVLGTNRNDPDKAPPCATCIHQSRILYTGIPGENIEDGTASELGNPDGSPNSDASRVYWFTFDRDTGLEGTIRNFSLEQLSDFDHHGLPLGALCLPGLRWILRRHHLSDDESTRYLLREYILSAWSIAGEFSKFIERTNPRVVIVFNGQFFPEAVARFVALKKGIRVITHEVGLQPASAFFTDGEATAYPIRIPTDFDLNAEQNDKLDDYLQKRFQGRFTMAGIQFWPEMRSLDNAFLSKAARFKQIVPVFTNVIFDTSQPHANHVFTDMFAWLDLILEMIRTHPETLFVIRAHPDETRLRKESLETVQAWVEANGVNLLENVIFIAPKEYLSSYELINQSKFVMFYNSTIGLEASILGVPALCSGKARFTQYETVFFPTSVEEQRRTIQEFLDAESIQMPREHILNARRFLYFQLFKSSLPFGDFLRPSVRATQTRLTSFDLGTLLNASSMRTITSGVLDGKDFVLNDGGDG